MITISNDFDLGRDETRIKDKRDAHRQARTVEVLLDRMFAEPAERRWDIQLVADEVGMGKTFVALGLAYSILAAMRTGTDDPDLRGCGRKVLVIAPQNTSLTAKWFREVREFVRRCIPEELAIESREWFSSEQIERLDDLAARLRSDTPGVIVTHMGVLTGGKKFRNYDLKRRFLLGVMLRFWGVRFPRDARERLLKGAPEGWPRRAEDLRELDDDERASLPFSGEEEVLAALRTIANEGGEAAGELEELLVLCKEIAEPYARSRDERFAKVEKKLNVIYRWVCFAEVTKALPLVIVDEAHNWKNGPSQKTNGYAGFERYIGPLARRVLLLTATPFQLRPNEMLELLRVGAVIAPSSDREDVERRRQRLETHRNEVIAPVLQNAAAQSRTFAKSWSRLPRAATTSLSDVWTRPELDRARATLRDLAHLEGEVDRVAVERLIEGVAVGQDPDHREILREGLRLFTYNEDLSQELGAFVIRHRRRTDHRLVRVGSEFVGGGDGLLARADRNVLHAAPGIDVRGDGELPHYLLMRCVSEMKKGKGRSSLGSALTGCYSTLLHSAEGKGLRSRLDGDGVGGVYLDLLLGLVGEAQDPEHPKVRAAVESVLRAWRAGEKSLIFCFRTNTARRLQEILEARIGAELRERRDAVLEGAGALGRLRSRFTRREGDLIVLGLDRVLWSLRWASWSGDLALPELKAKDLRLTDDEMSDLARLALRYGVDLRDEQVDRVFLHRAVEHLLGRRLATLARRSPLLGSVLAPMQDEGWVRAPYGLELDDDGSGGDEADHAEERGLDERGVHVVYKARIEEPREEDVRSLANDILERRERARRQDQVSIFDTYAIAPSFWLGNEPEHVISEDPATRQARTLSALHAHLLALSRRGKDFDWRERMLVLQSLRRALMRESVLLRLLPERDKLGEQGWGQLLVERFFTPLPGQRESMADRLAVFVEDLQAADGSVHEEDTPRHSMYEATRMRGANFVVLVDGSTASERRERVFAGFNSPLLPEVLVCTTVGQEGIDLHRHCRNVIHFDLAWNPAVLEQRTGRVDRIGSKTFRERVALDDPEGAGAFLDVGVPFLAGTYDERMYEEIRIRAQTFEVLTGGDVSADNTEGRDDEEGAEGKEEGLAFPMLPPKMVADLRVRLHVWEA